MAVGTRMQQRRATESVWNTSDYILAPGEIGVTTDTGIIKVGNGTSPWSELPPAFDSHYLPILGTAADSDLLGGVGPSGYVKFTDTDTAATGNKVAKRLSDGRIKAVAGTATDDVVNLTQLSSSFVSQTATANVTLALTDAGKMVIVNNSAYTPNITVTVPPNSSVAFPIGTFVDIVSSGKGVAAITAGAGVTISGHLLVYGGGSSARLVKTGTDAWRVVNVSLSPPPLLRRNIKAGSSNVLDSGFFITMKLDSADSPSTPYSNNQDTLGAGEQWSATNITRCYCRRSGYYTIRMQASFHGSTGARFFIEPFFNGNIAADYLGAGIQRSGAEDAPAIFSALVPITVGDYMEVACYQDAAGSPEIQQQPYVPSFVEWKWERPL